MGKAAIVFGYFILW